MSEMRTDSSYRRRGPRSLFWPVILIAVGLVFLLRNLGMLPGDAGDTLISLWPLILVLIGIDGLLDRSGVAGPVFMIGLGFIFLLANFGYLELDVWQVIFTLWPILLIAWGFDVMVGRRSWLASLAAVVVLLVILAGAVGVLTGRISVRGLRGSAYHAVHNLGSAQRLDLNFDIPVGVLRLSPGEAGDGELVGDYSTGNGFDVVEDFQVDGGSAAYHVTTRGDVVAFPIAGGNLTWDYRLPPGLPLEVVINQGAGALNLDLEGLQVEDLEADFGAGQLRVVLPSEDLTARLSGGVGLITVVVPEDAGVRIRRDTAMAFFNLPNGYEQDGEVYVSPGYADAAVQIDLEVDLAVGGVDIRE